MKRLILSWVITLFFLLSPVLLHTTQAQCPSATATYPYHFNGVDFKDGGFELAYLGADIRNSYYVRLTFKVINHFKNNGMDYLACQMPAGAGLVSSGVSCKSDLGRTYVVNNGGSISGTGHSGFYGGKVVAVDEKSQFKVGGNFDYNYDTYTLDMSLYEFSALNSLTVAVRAGGDGKGSGNQRYFFKEFDISGCKAELLGSVGGFSPGAITGPAETPMAGSIVQYSIPEGEGQSFKWGVPDVNDAQNISPGWEILDGGNTNTVTVKVGSAGGSMRVEVTKAGVGTNARTMPVAVVPNPLPVELVKFMGAVREGAVELNWSTATEIDNARFEVERSSNGKDFVKIAEVKGAGNSSVLVDYSFKDKQAPSGTVYYRLNQVDFDNSHEYSKVIAVRNMQAGRATSMRVHPNPVTEDRITVLYDHDAGQTAPVRLRVMDMSGKTMHTKELQDRSGEISLELRSLGLRKGLYMLSLTTGTKTQVQRILIH